MIRLKYTEVCGLLKTDWFTLGPNLIVRGVIDLENNNFIVHSFDSDNIYTGQAKDLRQAKSKLKTQLKRVGVNFEDEIRRTHG